MMVLLMVVLGVEVMYRVTGMVVRQKIIVVDTVMTMAIGLVVPEQNELMQLVEEMAVEFGLEHGLLE